jgi:hypothetical protein
LTPPPLYAQGRSGEDGGTTRIDYEAGLVYYEDWNEGYYNGATRVESLDSYLARMVRQGLVRSWEESKRREQLSEELTSDRDGLVPEINLPKLPLFGEGSKIDIAGSDRITLGGRQTSITGLPQSGTSAPLLPELKLEQALRINVNGSIGDKTKIFLDHDSERQFESKNKIRLTYDGTEDDIVQSIEAGDTRLVIPSTGYTGDLPAHKGLFGVSARGKLGGVDIYSVAAREQSESQTMEFRQRNQSHVDTIWDTDFLRYTIYRLDTAVTPRNIGDLRVYIDDGNPYNNTGAQRCRATIYPDNPAESPAYSGDQLDGYFDLKLGNTDYYVPPTSDYIEFNPQSMSSNYTVAISYKYNSGRDSSGGYKWYNEATGETLLVLKLLKPQRPDSTSLTWNLEFKNIYSIAAQDIKLDTIRLLRRAAGEQPTEMDEKGINFLRLIGLDPDGDGTVTWPQLDKHKGYLVCPHRFPFVSESLTVPDSIYDLNNPTSYPQRKYFFVIKYSTAKESYNLGQTDLEDGSERVYVNGQVWTRDVDYKVNYTTGELTFIRALPPDADIRITYEYRPLFSSAQKTLLGARAEWKFLDNGRFGSSIFYRTEEVPEEKPSLGGEPFQRMVAETDFGYDVTSDFVTSLLDKLPLVRADAPTVFHIGGEGAVSLPDPNTRGTAYLDDFEGSTISRDVGTRYRLWQWSSVPVGKSIDELAAEPIVWFNPVTRIPKESIFGKDIGEESRDMVEYMRIYVNPDNLGSWSGLMTCPSRLGMNLSDLENIEGVLRTRRRQGRLHITVGTSIDEDAPRRRSDGTVAGYNGREDTEDRNHNGILDEAEGEDTGIDSVAAPDQSPPLGGDDGNDDYNLNTNPNGTEGNKGSPDGEDLMGSGWTRSNDYFEYSVSLTDTVVVKDLASGWKSLRVSLRDPVRSSVSGSPRLEDIRLVRVWFDSFPGADTVDVYSLACVGSKWRNPSVVKAYPQAGEVDSSENLSVSLISKKTDPGYNPPFEPHKDQLGRTELEAALKLSYTNLKPGHRGIVRRATLERDDYRDYRALRLYVHNDPNNPDFFLQIGSDSINYYELRQPINSAIPVPGRPDWYEIRLKLDTLPTIKYGLGPNRDSVTRLVGFAVAGNPSLADVRYMAMGIENAGSGAIDGAVWLDDIRVADPRRDPGFGFNTAVSLRLSDLASLNLGYRFEDPNFRRFSEGRGVKTGGYSNTVGYGVDVAFDRFFPVSWGLSLPFNYSRSQARTEPKYTSNYPDLRLPEDRRAEELGQSANESWSFSLHKNKSSSRIMNYTLEALSYSYRRSTGSSRSLLDIGSSVANAHALGYAVNPDLKFKLGATEVSYFPQTIRLSGQLSRSSSPADHRNHAPGDSSGDTTWVRVRSDSSAAASYDLGLDYSPVSDLSFNYSLSADQDLTDENLFQGINLGQESGRDGTFGASYGMEIGEILSPRIDFDGNYNEDRPRFGGHYTDRRNVSNSGDIDLSTDFDLPAVLEALGKLRDENQDKSAVAGSPHWLLMQLERSDEVLSGIDLSYTYARSSGYTDITVRPPLGYQFGFADQFAYDSLFPPTAISREISTDFNASTDLRIKNLDTRWRYSRSWSRDVSGYNPTGNISTTWPDVSVSLARVEGVAPKLLTSASLSSGYQLRTDFVGTYGPSSDTFELVNRRLSKQASFSPLLSWQATWKNKITTTLSGNYSTSQNLTYLEAERATSTQNQSRSVNFSLGYSFSAPQGIRFPGLRKLKFSSDLGLNLGLTYGTSFASTTGLDGETVISDNNQDFGATLGLSYRFSRSIEAGLNSGYSAHRSIQRDINTRTTDLNFWVLFKF